MKSIATLRVKTLFYGICLALIVSACQEQSRVLPAQQQLSPVVAEVGKAKIYEHDIDYEILSMPESMRGVMQSANARARILDILIKREALAQKAQDMGLHLDPLISYRMHQATNAVLIQGVNDWQTNDISRPTPEKIQAYFKKHVSDFTVPEQIHVRHILVSDKQKALDILTQLKSGQDSFQTLAAQYSIDDSNKGRGGDLNWFAKGTMVKKFEDAAFALNATNKLSQPVKTEFGWHIIEWLGARESNFPTLEETADEIVAILNQQKMDAAINDIIDSSDISILKSEYKLK
ncbi:MAG: hypothetical protein AUK35_04040 [Zetaproteobacteria bacterium CG2_30_46_52]|nr:MAG: hypothetical protein AUK35_04040 [Zetaproteobacteria bacterium CG2_30_46_52]